MRNMYLHAIRDDGMLDLVTSWMTTCLTVAMTSLRAEDCLHVCTS